MEERRETEHPNDEGLTTADLAGRRPTAEDPRANQPLEPVPPLDDLRVGTAGEPGMEQDRALGEPATPELDATEPLFPPQAETDYRARWDAIQVQFVDQPKQSVREADGLVAEVMREMAEGFSSTRSSLESQWDRGDDVSTEDLRQALQRYRSFFQRLLAA